MPGSQVLARTSRMPARAMPVIILNWVIELIVYVGTLILNNYLTVYVYVSAYILDFFITVNVLAAMGTPRAMMTGMGTDPPWERTEMATTGKGDIECAGASFSTTITIITAEEWTTPRDDEPTARINGITITAEKDRGRTSPSAGRTSIRNYGGEVMSNVITITILYVGRCDSIGGEGMNMTSTIATTSIVSAHGTKDRIRNMTSAITIITITDSVNFCVTDGAMRNRTSAATATNKVNTDLIIGTMRNTASALTATCSLGVGSINGEGRNVTSAPMIINVSGIHSVNITTAEAAANSDATTTIITNSGRNKVSATAATFCDDCAENIIIVMNGTAKRGNAIARKEIVTTRNAVRGCGGDDKITETGMNSNPDLDKAKWVVWKKLVRTSQIGRTMSRSRSHRAARN